MPISVKYLSKNNKRPALLAYLNKCMLSHTAMHGLPAPDAGTVYSTLT